MRKAGETDVLMVATRAQQTVEMKVEMTALKMGDKKAAAMASMMVAKMELMTVYKKAALKAVKMGPL